MAKPWKQQALILVAALLLGLSLPVPGSAAPVEVACSRGLELFDVFSPDRSCTEIVLNRFVLIDGISEEDVGTCCDMLKYVISNSKSGDCACSLQKAFAQGKINVDRVCKLDMTKEECQAKEDADKAKADAEKAKADAEKQQAQQREAELSKLGACDRLFERLAAGERSEISRDKDLMACRQEMKTCQGKQ